MIGEQEATPIEPAPAAAAPPLPRRRFQFSLATLLWLTTVVACLAAVWAMHRNLRKAEVELQTAHDELLKYRGEMGYLDVSDPSKVYVRSLRTAENNKWSWRIHLPPKAKSRLCVSTTKIPIDGFPVDFRAIPIQAGEHIIDASVGPRGSEKWQLCVRVVGKSGWEQDVNAPSGGIETITLPETQQEMAEPGSSFALLRWRTWGNNHPYSPCDGLMIWIEEANP